MYINRAYLGELHEDIVDISKPLLITAVGNFRMLSKKSHSTNRKNGRADYQLIYIAEGKMHLLLDGKEQTVAKGNMILFRPGDRQCYTLYAKDLPETYWVHFTGADVESILEKNGIKRGATIFFTGISRNYKWIFRQMIQELQLKRTSYMDVLISQLQQIITYIGRNVAEGPLVTADLLNEIETAMHYFNKNFHQQIVIEDYAKEHNITPWWFIQNFKKIAHVTPAQYILSLRINNAMNLLDSTEYSVSEVAAAVGYENALYFSRLFKKHVGKSPSEYRKFQKPS